MSSALMAIVAAYVALNLIAFAAFGWDKHKAKNDRWRTPEKTLMLLGLFGPWGAVAGMGLFHHKTRKARFKAIWLFCFIHLLLIAFLGDRFLFRK